MGAKPDGFQRGIVEVSYRGGLLPHEWPELFPWCSSFDPHITSENFPLAGKGESGEREVTLLHFSRFVRPTAAEVAETMEDFRLRPGGLAELFALGGCSLARTKLVIALGERWTREELKPGGKREASFYYPSLWDDGEGRFGTRVWGKDMWPSTDSWFLGVSLPLAQVAKAA